VLCAVQEETERDRDVCCVQCRMRLRETEREKCDVCSAEWDRERQRCVLCAVQSETERDRYVGCVL